jgi:hypothetical protein
MCFSAGARDFLFSTVSTLAVGPVQPHIQWVLKALILGGKNGWSLEQYLHPLYIFVAWYLFDPLDATS